MNTKKWETIQSKARGTVNKNLRRGKGVGGKGRKRC